jgi:hypothetical protein
MIPFTTEGASSPILTLCQGLFWSMFIYTFDLNKDKVECRI